MSFYWLKYNVNGTNFHLLSFLRFVNIGYNYKGKILFSKISCQSEIDNKNNMKMAIYISLNGKCQYFVSKRGYKRDGTNRLKSILFNS
jgi:hypothetical protein